MRGPIQAPILLPFGNRNTQAEPHRAVPCANKRGQQRHARSILDRSLPCLPCPSIPRFAEPRRACDDVHRQAFLASPAVPHQTFRARSRLASHAFPGLPHLPSLPCLCGSRLSRPRLSLPAIPFSAEPSFLAMPAVRCRASIAPDLATPCLPIRTCPSAPSHACSTLPHQTQPCPCYLACHAPARPYPPGLASRALP